MNDPQASQLFEKAPVWQAVLKNAVPAMAAMLMVLVYNLADTFFIGQTGDPLQVAAVSLATPVFLLFMATGTIFSIGGTSVMSRAMGEGRYEYASKVNAFCFWSCVVVGLLMSGCFLLFMDQILILTGASADTWEYARQHLTIVSLCGPFVLISTCFSNTVRAEGKSMTAMGGQLLGNLLNVILDPVFILIFGWNIAGAAIATVIDNVAGTLFYFLFFWRHKSALSISLHEVSFQDRIVSSVLVIGIPASLGSLLMSVSQIIVNAMMSQHGDLAVAAIGVAMKIVMITSMLCIGLGQGIQPLLGYCAGAGLWDRFHKSIKVSCLFGVTLSVLLTVGCYAALNQIVLAFLQDPDAYATALSFSRILLSTSFLFGLFYVLINALQALGAANAALIVNLSRQGLIYIPALFLMHHIMGMTGLVWAQPAADILSTLLVIFLYFRTMKKIRAHKADLSCAAF